MLILTLTLQRYLISLLGLIRCLKLDVSLFNSCHLLNFLAEISLRSKTSILVRFWRLLFFTPELILYSLLKFEVEFLTIDLLPLECFFHLVLDLLVLLLSIVR
jgi:hypothetical protein